MTTVEVMPVSEHERVVEALCVDVKNHRLNEENALRHLDEALARSQALRATVHGHVQVMRGMCTDELDHREIDRALVRLDNAVAPADHNEEEQDA